MHLHTHDQDVEQRERLVVKISFPGTKFRRQASLPPPSYPSASPLRSIKNVTTIDGDLLLCQIDLGERQNKIDVHIDLCGHK
jgi:hypothetical protein